MATNTLSLIFAALAMVTLTFAVGLTMLFARMAEMRSKRVHPQQASTSITLAARLENVQAADNFRNLFEVPVLFYTLVAITIAVGFVPPWLVYGAWAFVALRLAHSVIHCTYNRVYHRSAVFIASFVLLLALWIGFAVSLASLRGS